MRPLLLCPALILMLACERPEVEAFRRQPAPIVVKLSVPTGVSLAVEKEYSAALRAKVATLATVVPEGMASPVGAAELKVTLYDRSQHRMSPAAVGVATGMAVGMLSAMAGNRDAAFDGLFWGLWAGTSAAESRRMELARLGYQPPRIEAQVELRDALSEEPLLTFMVNPREVIDEMWPLHGQERGNELAQREEEAKAFAAVIARRIQREMQWLPLHRPSWYGNGNEFSPTPKY